MVPKWLLLQFFFLRVNVMAMYVLIIGLFILVSRVDTLFLVVRKVCAGIVELDGGANVDQVIGRGKFAAIGMGVLDVSPSIPDRFDVLFVAWN